MKHPKENRNAFFVYLYMAIVGGIFLSLIGYGLYDRQKLTSAFERSGVTITATYVGGRVLTASSRPERPPTFQYFGQVQFLVDGQAITAEAPVSSGFHRTVEPGDSVQIRYLSEEPETVQIDPLHETREFGLVWMIVLFLVGCLGYWLIRKQIPKPKPKPKVVPSKLKQLLTELEPKDVHDDTDRTNNSTPDIHQQGGGRP